MDPKLKELIFEANSESPGGWFMQALNLRVAADRLDWIEKPVQEEEDSVSLLAEYRLLMALSFENLLKGLILLQRIGNKETPAFPSSCYTHNLEDLAKKIDINGLVIDQDELNLLSTLTPYIEWAGRYPLPKRKGAIITICHGSRERQNELRLWDKLSRVLKDKAWIMKGGSQRSGGTRLYLNKKNQP